MVRQRFSISEMFLIELIFLVVIVTPSAGLLVILVRDLGKFQNGDYSSTTKLSYFQLS